VAAAVVATGDAFSSLARWSGGGGSSEILWPGFLNFMGVRFELFKLLLPALTNWFIHQRWLVFISFHPKFMKPD